MDAISWWRIAAPCLVRVDGDPSPGLPSAELCRLYIEATGNDWVNTTSYGRAMGTAKVPFETNCFPGNTKNYFSLACSADDAMGGAGAVSEPGVPHASAGCGLGAGEG